MRKKYVAEKAVQLLGGDILASKGMQLERGFYQHGSVTVYEHSLAVAVMCVRLSRFMRIKTDLRALVRGALLHDYFLYDWHIPDPSHRLHAFTHPRRALMNARRDFAIGGTEGNMILSHMFPMSTVFCREPQAVSVRQNRAAAKMMDTILLMGCSSLSSYEKTVKAKCFDR